MSQDAVWYYATIADYASAALLELGVAAFIVAGIAVGAWQLIFGTPEPEQES